MLNINQMLGTALTAYMLFISATFAHAQKISLEDLSGGKKEANGQPQAVFTRPSPIEDKEIVAEGIGSGESKQDALRDAMKRAIEKAVGMYVTSKTTMKDEDLKEQIIVTSDAVVTNYKVIDSFEHNGVWVVKIEAKVLPNEYLKYAPKIISQDVSLDIANILNTTQSIESAKDVIDEIFEDEYYKIYQFEKTDIRMGDNVDPNGNNVSLKINYTLKFNQNEYNKFRSRLCAYLDKIARYKGEFERSYYRFPNDRNCDTLWKEAGLDMSEKGNYRTIEFVSTKNDKKNVNELKYVSTSYLVRKEFFELIRSKVINNVYLIISLLPENGNETHKAFLDARINFGVKRAGFSGDWLYDKDAKPYDFRDTIYFTNWTVFQVAYGKKKTLEHLDFSKIAHAVQAAPFEGTLTMDDMPKDYIKKLKYINIYILNNEDNLDEDKRLEKANEIEKKIQYQ